ncbi:SDR family NAD(P)-dependent oxidoreductase [Brevibacterium sp. 2SA]|uniref:SDR family oxidoreductase n=1 Tax=Brevibacterium sp. 2SA TaxID=2502198 RepID=UPI0010F74A32|nr:SDR family NAD(P)-dependent oxidoreductase [Brevibacterium sp. 2SA]
MSGPHVISGGASGVGLVTAQRLLAGGESVVIIDRDELPAEVVDQPNLTFFQRDVGDLAAMAELGVEIRDRWPQCTSVIASAGINYVGPFAELPFSQWNEVLTTNVIGALHLIHEVLPSLIATAGAGERADVITIGSIADQSYFHDAAVYGAASAALKTFAAQLRIELREQGVRVSNIAPGYIRSTFAERLEGLAHEYDWLGEGLLTSDDVADVIGFVLDQPVGVALGDLDVVATKQGWA